MANGECDGCGSDADDYVDDGATTFYVSQSPATLCLSRLLRVYGVF